MKYNQALTYAASRPNYLGGQGLIYPLKSSTFRAMMADAKGAFGSGVAIGAVFAEYQALGVEIYQGTTGGCQ